MSSAFESLTRLRRLATTVSAAEFCDLCHVTLLERHQHLFEPSTRRIQCVCDGCAVLFAADGRTRYRRVPRRIRYLPEFQLTDAQWDAFMIPIGIAFLFHSSLSQRVMALYPSPAGPVESALTLETWSAIEAENPLLRGLEPDVEGLLVYRVANAREHYLIPIDECFKLIGIIRMNWKGLSGGAGVWERVTEFLSGLRST